MEVYLISKQDDNYTQYPLCITVTDINVALSRINGIIDSYEIYDADYPKPPLEHTNPELFPMTVYCGPSFTFTIRQFSVCTQ